MWEIGCITLRGPGYDSRDWIRTLRTFVEQKSCSLRLLEFVPMHSDSQQFVRVAIWGETFTAITRVQIPSGTPNRMNDLRLICAFQRNPPVTLL
jgi:hypothetical protein